MFVFLSFFLTIFIYPITEYYQGLRWGVAPPFERGSHYPPNPSILYFLVFLVECNETRLIRLFLLYPVFCILVFAFRVQGGILGGILLFYSYALYKVLWLGTPRQYFVFCIPVFPAFLHSIIVSAYTETIYIVCSINLTPVIVWAI